MQTFIKVFLLLICVSQLVYARTAVVFSVLSLDQVAKRVIANNKGKVLDAKTAVVKGKKVHIIKVLTTDGRVQYLKIEAATGKTIR